jgi:hypothetical protein
MKINFRLNTKLNTLIFSFVMAFVVGLTIGKTTETTIVYHQSDSQNIGDFSELNDFSELDFNNTNKPDPITDIKTEFNYTNALVYGVLTFGIILVLSGLKKEDNN